MAEKEGEISVKMLKELSLVLIGIVIALSVIWGYNTNLRTRRLEINQDQIIQLIRNQQPRPVAQP